MNTLTAEDIQAVLRPIFPNLDVTFENEGTEKEPANVYNLGYTGAGLRQVEMEVTRHSILGSKTEVVQGWQGFVAVTRYGGRWEPDDVDDCELTEPFEHLGMAVTAAAGALVMSAVSDALADVGLAEDIRALDPAVPF